ncbi:MAG: multidrug ABC transporter ATP-binding protein [Candidatus Rokuibacteriota bacterium]|nr:MAG: multidrug ABC transporter ATP-binding protein [Candidatus Rokubacteria bacterium]
MSSLVLTRSGVEDQTRSPLRSLLSLLPPWRVRVALVAVSVLAAAAFELAPPLVIRTIVDAHLIARQPDGLLFLAFLYLAAASAVQAMTFLYNYAAATIAQGVLSALRVRLFAHVLRLPTRYFDRVPMGDVISRCTADVETLDTVFSSNVALLLANLVRLGAITVAMLALSVPLSLVAALVVPPLAFVTRVLQVRVRQAERENRLAVGAINARLQENLGSVEVIRAFGRVPEFVAGFRQILRRGLAAFNRSSFFSAVYTPMTAILSALAVAALLWAGTQHVFAAFGISLGTLTAFLILTQRFFQPITALGEEWQTVQGAMAGAERIFGTLALSPEGTLPVITGDGLGVGQRPIMLSRVEFGYAEGQPVLHRISLEVKRGEHVALVGRTGAGKTSALHLVAGLYQPWSGSIRVAGRDPVRLDESERRRVLGVVPQVVQLFSGTVMENLTLDDPSISDAAVYEACRIAGADAFIRALPQGYHTGLSGSGGGTGTHLSAGQQQLLALARALVGRPLVLLFDEATTANDSASDANFRAALRVSVLPQGCGVLTVAHRLSTALETDRIIVLDKGYIVEEGQPAELVASRGRFAALLELEAAGWDWRTGV